MEQLKDECVTPTKGPIFSADKPKKENQNFTGGEDMLIKVGKEAIDFETSAFVPGFGFKPLKLSDYKGKWIVLCFYPGDFTFV